MLVLQILGVLAVIALLALLVTAVCLFDQRVAETFGYSFLDRPKIWMIGASGALLWAGELWRRRAVEAHGDTLNGVLLIGIGGAIALAMVVRNFQRTRAPYAALGTLLQLGLLPLVFQLGMLAAMLGAVWFILVAMSTRPVWVVNR